MKLISMTDFVLEQDITLIDSKFKIVNYANFLKQPLKLEMFVPCVDNEPFNYSKHGNAEQYEQAKEKVLFEGFDEDNANMLMYYNDSIEHIVYNNIELTQNATKKFL